MTKIYPINEIVTASVVANFSKDDLSGLVDNPKDFLKSTCDIDLIDDITFNLVENTDSEMNLALPYYSIVDDFTASALSNEDAENVSGGEIIMALSMLGATIAAAVGFASVSGTVAAVIGGSVVAAGVVAGAIAVAGVAAGAGVGVSHGVKNAVKSK